MATFHPFNDMTSEGYRASTMSERTLSNAAFEADNATLANLNWLGNFPPQHKRLAFIGGSQELGLESAFLATLNVFQTRRQTINDRDVPDNRVTQVVKAQSKVNDISRVSILFGCQFDETHLGLTVWQLIPVGHPQRPIVGNGNRRQIFCNYLKSLRIHPRPSGSHTDCQSSLFTIQVLSRVNHIEVLKGLQLVSRCCKITRVHRCTTVRVIPQRIGIPRSDISPKLKRLVELCSKFRFRMAFKTSGDFIARHSLMSFR
jgi:hypothetical protein